VHHGSSSAVQASHLLNKFVQWVADHLLRDYNFIRQSRRSIPPGIMSGFCKDGVTPCNASQSVNYYGLNMDCGGAGTCSDNGQPCTPGFDQIYTTFDDDKLNCANPFLAFCNPNAPFVGDGTCWSGCGPCTPGRPLNCAAFVYTGANSNAGPGDLKCTGAPYSLANPNSGPNTNAIGTVPNPGSMPFTVAINAADSSYCVHTFQIQDDPYGDVFGYACTATCGDGVIAVMNGEVCEPGPEYPDLSPLIPNHAGCNDMFPTCLGCAACGTLGLCGNGVTDSPSELCDDGVLGGMSGYCNAFCNGYVP
jgi:hypothetical protein